MGQVDGSERAATIRIHPVPHLCARRLQCPPRAPSTQLIMQYLDLPGHEGLYKISDQGDVWSYRSNRHLQPQTNPRSGYRYISISLNGKRRMRTVHSLVLLAFVGPRTGETRHLDGDPSNNHLSNLAWGTRSENVLDTVRHGTHVDVKKTHCKRNHPFTPENTRIYKGSRKCRICEYEKNKARRLAAA